MSEQKHLSKKRAVLPAALVLMMTLSLSGTSFALEVKPHETALYKDVFEQNIYYEGTSYLRLDRLYRLLFRKKAQAQDINIYDEVPDSAFFVNRHGRQALSLDNLRNGYSENSGPDLSANLRVVSGVFKGLQPDFVVEDAKGDRYLLNFDPSDSFELSTSADVIASRFYHAIGYHVPQITIVVFPFEKLVVAEGAKVVDDSGFSKAFTMEKLEEYLLFLPTDDKGHYRASATKVLAGEDKGFFRFSGQRGGAVDTEIDHERRRSLRALRVFASWLNHTDIRPGHTQVLETVENGEPVLKYYLTNFSSALGATPKGPKPPMLGHEHLYDYGEATKAFLSLGWWEKPWQRRWREAGQVVAAPQAIGYFDNRYFDPADFKLWLPDYAFKDMTRADGFWAAKIISSFTDEEIRAMVEAGKLSAAEDSEYLIKTLIERRDIIVRYWFQEANSLDMFELSGKELRFENLAVKAGVVSPQEVTYQYEVISSEGERGQRLATLQTNDPRLTIDPAWFSSSKELKILIRASYASSDITPYVLVEVDAEKILSIMRED